MNEKNTRLVTAESIRAGHPDKFCDQVADAILDAHLRQDPNARVAVEVFATADKIVVGGEITSKAEVDGRRIVADVINRIGYTMSDLCENYATKEGKSITRQTGEVEWTAIRRTHDNQYQAVKERLSGHAWRK